MKTIPFFDGHNDTLSYFSQARGRDWTSFLDDHPEGAVTLPKARRSGYVGGFFAAAVPGRGDRIDRREARAVAVELFGNLARIEAASAGQVRVVRSRGEIQDCIDNGILAAVAHLEGADGIDDSLVTLEMLHHAGVRSLGIVCCRPNVFAECVPVENPTASPTIGAGLTAAGRRLVSACNEMRIMVDVSHLTVQGFWDVASVSDAPLVATHSNAYSVVSVPRNLQDDQLDAIRDSGGVVGASFYTGMLRADGKADPKTPLEPILQNIEYLVERMGIDHVAIGTDLGTATCPEAAANVETIPALLRTLQSRGWSEQDLHALAHKNWLRVLDSTWGDRTPEGSDKYSWSKALGSR